MVSRYDHKATCQKKSLNPSPANAPCVIIPNGDASNTQKCYTQKCTAAGVCQKFNNADGIFCDTPPNTVISNGYGCSQYVCQSGRCNTSYPVAISEGAPCAGAVLCDPTLPGCNSECQSFVCKSGKCTVNMFNENNPCSHIKPTSARTTTISSDCAVGKCFQGVCKAFNAQNGSSCGNRTRYNDRCYGDYCDNFGNCVHTGRRDCSGVFPLPSICWDVTCDKNSGDCVLRTNGVVDCSCITDCSACTAVFDITDRHSTAHRTLGCYWCVGQTGSGKNKGCYNHYLPGDSTAYPAPNNAGRCYTNDSPCGGGGGLTGGQIAGIIIGILGVTSLALLAIAIAILLLRYFAGAGTPPANACLTDLAFDKNVKNNCFYEGAQLEQCSALYADPHFVTK